MKECTIDIAAVTVNVRHSLYERQALTLVECTLLLCVSDLAEESNLRVDRWH